MDNTLYTYSPIIERPPLRWPDGARLAFYLGLNVEHYHVDRPATSISPVSAGLAPDPMNHGWRDYAARVGIWRLVDVFDDVDIRPSVLLNSEVCDRYPQIVAAGRERNWSWLAHGETNSQLHHGFADDEAERQSLTRVVESIRAATGTEPRGWLGPAMTETFATPRLLAELGLTYVLDWNCDDQPFALSEPGMWSVPYSAEINDITQFLSRGATTDEYESAVMAQFEQLLEDGATTGRVMALPVHAFLLGQPFRIKTLRRILERIVATDDVWVTTSDEIAAHFAATAGAAS
jgi:allantoinase